MTKNPIVATLPGNRTDVLKLLVQHKITGLPVVRKDKTLVGFVARNHIFAKPEEEQLAMIMVRDFPSVQSNTGIKEIAHVLVDNDINYLPVTDKSKLVGIITPVDLLSHIGSLHLDRPVEELVRKPCVPVHESTPINVASEIMRLGKVVAVPVLDSNNHLTGLVTDRDVFNLSVINGKMAMRELGLAGEEDAWTWEGLRNIMRLYYEERKIDLPRMAVRDIMIRKPVTVFRKTGVSEAALLMYRYDFGQLPIVDSRDKLYAMLYELDVVTALV